MVEIPDDVAPLIASYLRRTAEPGRSMHTPDVDAWADLLDPKPSPLREQVAEALRGLPSAIGNDEAPIYADAVLAVVADWLAAQPVHDGTAAGLWALEPRLAQRANDVRLLRGES